MERQIHYNKAVQLMRDIDTSGGRIAAYFATFDDVDKHGRKMDEGAFRRTIKNNGKKFYHLLNHNTSAIVGKVEEAGTDDKGAFFVSKLLPTTLGQDVLTMYKEGILNEHSFGFEIVHSIQMNSYELVKEVKVYEVSTVTFAANPNATTISVNSIMEWMEEHDKSREALEKINYLTSQLSPESLENSMKGYMSKIASQQTGYLTPDDLAISLNELENNIKNSNSSYIDAVKKLEYLAGKLDPEGIQNSIRSFESRLTDTQMQEQILKKLEQISNMLAGGASDAKDDAGVSDIMRFIEQY